VNLFLCGDVMTGRGIDQILQHPSEPTIYEPFMTSAAAYVELAEQASGPIPRPVDFAYVWGDALAEIEARSPDVRLVNLETAVTTSQEPLPKGINYRMHPANVPCLLAAGIDCCALANNHALDWGAAGLVQTLDSLRGAGIATAGAGRTLKEAARPAFIEKPGRGRVLVFAFGSPTSGIPFDWAATKSRPGVQLLPDLSDRTAARIADQIRKRRRSGDVVVASVHWGENWGYQISPAQRTFAHRLVDSGPVDILHGHSSHHVKGIEVYHGRLILYGCGDFINDYEGIGGHEEFHPDLVLAYFARLDPGTRRLARLEMVPFRSRRLRLERAPIEDAEWLRGVLVREGRDLNTGAELAAEGAIALRW